MNLKQIFGVPSDKYSAPAECNDCFSPTIPIAIDRDTGAIKVSLTGGGGGSASGFNIGEYDQIDYTYVAAGNGEGNVETATYILDGSTVATLTYTYDADDNITTVVKS